MTDDQLERLARKIDNAVNVLIVCHFSLLVVLLLIFTAILMRAPL